MMSRVPGVTWVVTSSYPDGPGDIRGNFVLSDVLALRAQGHTVQVVACGPRAEMVAPSREIVRVPSWLFDGLGVPDFMESVRGYNLWSAYAEGGRVFTTMLRHLMDQRSQKIGMVHSHWLLPCALATALALPGVPHRAHCHSGDLHLLKRLPMGRQVARWLCGAVDEIRFVSDALAQDFVQLCGEVGSLERSKLSVAPLPLSPAFQPNTAAPSCATRDPALVVAVGRLVPIKGFDVLIRALGMQARAVRPRLLLLGEGPQMARLQNLARLCRVSLHTPGAVEGATVARALDAAALCVVPSVVMDSGRTEGLPTIAREARARGCPLVVGNSGGLADWARCRNIPIVDSGDARGLARAIEKQDLRAGKWDAKALCHIEALGIHA